ncbi:phosphatidate cytidylyltransferase [Phycicoccus badiiscoriae]|uniref:Phosphatidate cytidylyltransferase n=1 Tax=Pedococcus badiiscoriae TaxID=642776 RepID=A0A852WKV0_9MICO|nr:phosphatidate cytidylyltransferase [Pedococcus badiiscoriae]NYG05902.1 phosphatidate cytidylyltransferase [Pedococcus badiiscoriae]
MDTPQSRRDRREARASAQSAAPRSSRAAAPRSSRAAAPRSRAAAAAPGSTAARSSRAGRNLPAAIGVGVGLGILIIGSLLLRKELMLGIVIVAAGVGVWELRRALAQVSIHVPLVPSLVGSVSMLVSAYVGGGEALVVTVGLTCVGILLWRVADGVLDAVRDIAGGFFVAVYPSFLAGFAALMLAARDDGARRIIVFILVTVLSDVGGYAFGVLLGRHPMAPSVSPKKSWEGFAGSVLTCVVGGAAAVVLLLHGPWWGGAVLGACAAVAATVGDLTESTIKRDLGIKDMSTILPGHGGVMDRLDSLVVVAPVAWAVLAWVVPPG